MFALCLWQRDWVNTYYKHRAIGLMSRMFANGPGGWGSIPGWIIPKTKIMVLDAALLNTQHYKVRIKGKVEQSRKWSSALGVVAIEKRVFGLPSTKVANFSYFFFFLFIISKLVLTFCLFTSVILTVREENLYSQFIVRPKVLRGRLQNSHHYLYWEREREIYT